MPRVLVLKGAHRSRRGFLVEQRRLFLRVDLGDGIWWIPSRHAVVLEVA